MQSNNHKIKIDKKLAKAWLDLGRKNSEKSSNKIECMLLVLILILTIKVVIGLFLFFDKI